MSEFPSHRHAITRCPQCGYRLDASTNISGGKKRPEEGDISVCINCGQVNIYQAALTMRKVTADEIREIMNDGKEWAVIEMAQRFIRKRGRFA